MKKLALLAALSLSPMAWAQQEVPPTPKPIRFQLQPGDMQGVLNMTPAPKLETAAYLGVVTSPVTAALREQLKLPKGIGLVVDHVEPDSPAASAGLKQYDILQKLNDQLLVNNQQLMVLTRISGVGEEVRLSVVRQGQPSTVAVKLAEKMLPPIIDSSPWGVAPIQWGADVLKTQVRLNDDTVHAYTTNADPTGLRTTMQVGKTELNLMVNTTGSKTLRITDTQTGKELFNGPIDTPEQRKAIPLDLAAKLDMLDTNTAPTQLQRGFFAPKLMERTTVIKDDDQTVVLERRTDSTHLTITRKDGTVTFDGPIDTAEQRKALPPDVTDQILQSMLNQAGQRSKPKPAVR